MLRPTPRLMEKEAGLKQLWLAFLLLVQGIAVAHGKSFTEFYMMQEASISSGPLGLCLVVSVATGLALALCMFRKRRNEGTYQPRKEEQTGARSVEPPNALKLPKEERLI